MKNTNEYKKAKKRLYDKQGFKTHLMTYVGVCLLLLIINLTNSPDYLWVKWPMMGWGIGLFFHGIGVYGFLNKPQITDEMIRREMDRNG